MGYTCHQVGQGPQLRSGRAPHPGVPPCKGTHPLFLGTWQNLCAEGNEGKAGAGAAVVTRIGCSNELFQKYLSLVRDALFLELQSITLRSGGVNVYL